MKKLAIFSAVLISLTGVVSAADYSTVLFDDDLDPHFTIEGWTSSQSYEETDVALRYNLTLTHPDFNSTKIDNFEIVLANNGERIASEQIGNFNLKAEESKTGFLDIQSDRAPNQINQIIFRSNHTGVTNNGYERPSSIENDIEHSITDKYPEIFSFDTNQSEVERGQNITVTANTSDIESLKVQSRNLTEVEDGSFQGRVKVPKEALDGEIEYTLETDAGTRFTRGINVSVENAAPEMNVSYSKEAEGDSLEINIDAEDDIKINQTYVNFQNQYYNATEENKISLPIHELQNKDYNFTAVAIDNEGVETRQNHSFKVVETSSQTQDNSEEESQDEDESGIEEQSEEDEEPAKSFPGILIDPIIEFIKSKI